MTPSGSVSCDYETSIIGALKLSWPECKISLCQVHFGRSIDKKINSLQLRSTVNNSARVKNFLLLIKQLCFVDLSNTHAFNAVQYNLDSFLRHVRRHFTDVHVAAFEEFVKYFRKTYLGFPDGKEPRWVNFIINVLILS